MCRGYEHIEDLDVSTSEKEEPETEDRHEVEVKDESGEVEERSEIKMET